MASGHLLYQNNNNFDKHVIMNVYLKKKIKRRTQKDIYNPWLHSINSSICMHVPSQGKQRYIYNTQKERLR